MHCRFHICLLTLVFATLQGLAETKTAPVSAVLQPYIERHELAGAVVLVATPEKILTTEAIGHADIAAGRSMQKDTLFWIASMTKTVTGTAFMILVDEGKVGINDPVEKYLPEFKGQMYIAEQSPEQVILKKPAQPITVRQILSHTSGMAFRSAIEYPTLDRLPLETYVRSYAASPLLFAPGTKYLYSNEGINTAGRIIEVVSGMKYEDFVQQRILDPLSMRDTTFRLTEAQAARLARAYQPNKEKNNLQEMQTPYLYYPLTDPGRYAMPGGGLFSTASDMARFGQMVLGHGMFEGKRILSEASVQTMLTRQTPDTLKESYGLGWNIKGPYVGHGGALSTDMRLDMQKKLLTIYLIQHSGFPGNGAKALDTFRDAAFQKYAPVDR